MWVYTKDGFFSAVEDRNNPEQVMVRARVRGDLERMLDGMMHGRDVKITYSGSDYLNRCFIGKHVWAAYLAQTGNEIDYFSAKDAMIPEDGNGRKRKAAYFRAWSAMKDMQDEIEG